MTIDREAYLEPSPIQADGGGIIGKLPGSISQGELRALGHPTSPVRAIRAKCVDCSGGSDAEVRKCVAVKCPLWPYRMGVNPFHGKVTAHNTSPSKLEGLA